MLQTITNHFIELYSEEIESGLVSTNTIHEWWGMTKDQYPDADYEAVEKEIMNLI